MEQLVTFARAARELEVNHSTITYLVEREGLQTFLLLSDKEGGRERRLLRRVDLERLKAQDGWRRRTPRMRGD